MIDPNNGNEMFESDDIVDYMLDTYGPPRDAYSDLVLWPLRPHPNPNPNPNPNPSSNPNQVLWPLRGAFMTTTATFATLFRGLAGSKRQANARPDNEEMLPLELWGYEPSPFVRPVREKLCGLCLRHVLVPTARGSANRDALIAKTGVQFQVPYLVDPNTGVALFESLEIIEYLDAVYTAD